MTGLSLFMTVWMSEQVFLCFVVGFSLPNCEQWIAPASNCNQLYNYNSFF